MKTLFAFPLSIYLIAGVASLSIMLIVDYILGIEAQHLNAWAVASKLFGNDIGIPDSLAIQKLGLYGAAFFMFVLNMIFGFFLINILRAIIKVVHLIFHL